MERQNAQSRLLGGATEEGIKLEEIAELKVTASCDYAR